MTYWLFRAVFTGLAQQSGPNKRSQNTGRERRHLAPSCSVPIFRLAVECLEQFSLCRGMIGLNVDHVHPDIPLSEWLGFEARVGRMIDLGDEVRDQLGK